MGSETWSPIMGANDSRLLPKEKVLATVASPPVTVEDYGGKGGMVEQRGGKRREGIIQVEQGGDVEMGRSSSSGKQDMLADTQEQKAAVTEEGATRRNKPGRLEIEGCMLQTTMTLPMIHGHRQVPCWGFVYCWWGDRSRGND
ncbi:hypothetical protein NDU88_004450 [Pleurodeles waltl]|uniref:Uncharacterized protein n=1 Tax=Pleurodeles waltl TaxID=8319 RepID=A0AAV7WVK6_PLEWA|nr:hypothetical protein NDU88_004450 [Pleurodeles waltl]